jgi:hypothetical protein
MPAVEQIAEWRARRKARTDVPVGSPPFVLEQPCPGCECRRVSTMVWRDVAGDGGRVPFPRIEPHFLCRDGRVLWQEITDAPIPVEAWSQIFGHFEESAEQV